MSETPAQARNGAIFFDRDGVLNEDVGYLYRREDFRWIPGARDALRLTQDAGLLSIVVTNQSGVARGLYGEEDVAALHGWMRDDLLRDGIGITAFYTCPYHANAVHPRYCAADHPDRKPNPGMILRAMQDWSIAPAQSLIIGDKQSDMIAGERAGIAGHLFTGGNLADLVAEWLASRTFPARAGER